MNKIIVYAIKDNVSGLYWNNLKKKFTELSQNVSFYKTYNNAKSKFEEGHMSTPVANMFKGRDVSIVELSINLI